MTDSRQDGHPRSRIIPDEDHVAHYCSPDRAIGGLPSGNAFALREDRGETYLSVDWLEILDPGSITAAIERLRPIVAHRIRVKRDGRLAVLNVGEARQVARRRGSLALRVVNWPGVGRGKSYARIENYGDSRAQRLRVAEAFRDLVQRCHMYGAA